MTIVPNPEYNDARYELTVMTDGWPAVVNRLIADPCHHRFNNPPPEETWKDIKLLREWIRENAISPVIKKP